MRCRLPRRTVRAAGRATRRAQRAGDAPRSASPGLGPADLVTLGRAVLVGGVTALVADWLVTGRMPTAVLVALAAVALALDAVDGRVARRTGTASARGARFDMEVDAVLVLVLSGYVAALLGPWTLAIGAMRYVFAVAGRIAALAAVAAARRVTPRRSWPRCRASYWCWPPPTSCRGRPRPPLVAAGPRNARLVLRPRRALAVAAPTPAAAGTDGWPARDRPARARDFWHRAGRAARRSVRSSPRTGSPDLDARLRSCASRWRRMLAVAVAAAGAAGAGGPAAGHRGRCGARRADRAHPARPRLLRRARPGPSTR